jgi:tetratricopeptide (TPR) repeat protein
MTNKPEIFFSYAWGDTLEQGESREKIVLDLHNSLKNDGYIVAIDKEDLGYTGYISKFMEAIGQGKAIVVAMSKKYARSPFCMFELYEIARNSKFNKEEFRQKVLPIMVEFVDFTKPNVLKEYFDYWEQEIRDWEALVQGNTRQLSEAQFLRYNKIKLVHQNFGELVDWIIDMNSLNKQLLAANDFAVIKQSLTEKLAAGKTTATAEGQIIPPPKHLTAPPFISKVFLGREPELEALHKKLFEENNFLLLVNGKGGVGKTSLAAHYYNRYAGDYQHIAWVLSEKSIANALLLLAEPLGIAFGETMNTEERLAVLLTKMATLPKPCLLVIDNANEPEDLAANFVALGRCPNFHLLLTSRITNFTEAESWHIDGLPAAEALQLFKKYYPKHQAEEDELFMAIHQAVDHNTLVVELLAKNLARLNAIQTHYTLADLLADLQGLGLLALSQSKTVETGYQAKGPGLRKEDPQDIIAAMYDLAELSDAEKRLLSVLAVLPAENIPFTILQTLLPNTANLEDTLTGLAGKGWIEQLDAAFKISPVVQEIAKKKNEGLLEDCRELIDVLIDKLDYEPGIGHFLKATYQEALVLARYGEAVAKNTGGVNYSMSLLLERLGNYHQTTGNLSKALSFYEDDAALSKELFEAYPDNMGFKNGLAISYEKLGQTHGSLGNLSKALSYYEDETVLFKELFEAYPDNVGFKNGLAISYEKLGQTHGSLGNLSKALSYYEDQTVLFKELFEAYPDNVGFKNGLAISYEKLGQTHGSLGNLSKALSFYEERSRLGKELFEAYPDNVGFKNGLAISFFKLGETHEAQGDKAQALEYYHQTKNILAQLVNAFPEYAEFKKNLDWVNGKLP